MAFPDSSTADPAGDVDRDEQSSPDSAATDAPDVETDETAADDSDSAEEPQPADDDTADSSDFLTKEERAALNAEPDLEKRAKGMEKAFLSKTRQLADTRKALGPWQDIAKGWQADPKETARLLAKQAGLEIVEPDSSSKTTTPDPAEPDPVDELASAIREGLGPEYEDLSDKLATVLGPAIDKVIAARTQPIQSRIATREEREVKAEADRKANDAVTAFSKAHPGWEKHEAAMLELSKRLPPGEGVELGQYMDYLYTLVTRDTSVAEAAKKAITRMQKSASAAAKTGSGVAADKVVGRPQGPISFDEAARMAVQGIRLE